MTTAKESSAGADRLQQAENAQRRERPGKDGDQPIDKRLRIRPATSAITTQAVARLAATPSK